MSNLGRMFQEILGALRELVGALFDPSRRVYGPFLLGAALLAVVALAARGVALRHVARELFSPRVWLHRSALADYRLIFARALLRATTYGAQGLSMPPSSLYTDRLHRAPCTPTVPPPSSLYTDRPRLSQNALWVGGMFRAWELHGKSVPLPN